MNFAAAAANSIQSAHTASAHSLAPFGNRGHQQKQKHHVPTNKPPPARSLSSIELAAIVNGVATPGVSAVPAHMSANPNATVLSASASAATAPGQKKISSNAPSNSGNPSSLGNSAPAWHKTVFDMIQEDFPKTPSNMFSSPLPSSGLSGIQDGGQHVEYRPSGHDRRARLPSTASLDIDLDHITAPELASDHGTARPADEGMRTQDLPPRIHHRRSASINWPADLSGLRSNMSRSSSRSNVAASPPSGVYFPSKPSDIPPMSSPLSSVVTGSGSISTGLLPAAVAASGSSSSAHSTSPTGSVRKHNVGVSSPQASPATHRSGRSATNVSHVSNGTHSQMNPYSLPSAGHNANNSLGSIDDLNVPGLGDYDLFYNPSEAAVLGPTTSQPSVFQTPTYPSSQRNIALASGLENSHTQSLGGSSQYANVFPGMGLFPSPFSTNPSGVESGTGVSPGYTESFRDSLAAADNLKNMSIQMAAFLSAQQQLYAAQMAHMAAITGTSAFTGSPTPYGAGAVPGGHVGHTSNASHMRSPWDARDPAAPVYRGYPRSKHHFDQYRGGPNAGPHLSNQKKNTGLDLGHKNRGPHGRRRNRGHEEVFLGVHKSGERVGFGNGGLSGGMQDSSHTRSALLEEFRATSLSIGRGIGSVGDVSLSGGFGAGSVGSSLHGGREWQLSEIKDNVVEFATDQHGSRFIQQKLESASPDDRDAILRQALTEAQRLMTDVFGNYVVQKLLDHGGANAVKLIAAELEGRMLVLSLHMYGCRVVQKALEVLEPGARSVLVRELDGHVLKCIRDQNGNHVIQKCVELVEPESVQFIVDSVHGQAVQLAGHSYGCRVVQRILEHGAPSQKAPIMVEIMSCITDLIKDQYGNYVIQHVVEHGTREERSIIMNLVRGEVCDLSQHKFASNVVERCLQHGSLDERQILIEILIMGEGDPNSSPLNHLVRDQFGNYVVQRVLDVARPPQRERVVTILRAQVPAIKKYSYGKHIIARLEEHQSNSGSTSYHHGQGHSHNGANHGSLHRERHVSPAMMPAGVSHSLPSGPNDYIYYG